MDSVRYGVIGLGFFGEMHAQVLSNMLGANLAAICTRRPDHLRDLAERYNVPNTYTDYHDLLHDDSVEAVSIVTHVNDHRNIAIDALNAGKSVFLEKPMAGSIEDCDAIIDAAKSAAGKFMVGHICRFDPRVNMAKSAIDEGRIGQIVSMHARRNLPAHIGAEVLDKISPLMGDGIHDVDLMLWMTGGRVESVYAQNVRIRKFKYPDISWAMCRFEGGIVGVIETAWCLPNSTPFDVDAKMEVIGTKGAVYIDCGETGLTINYDSGTRKPDTSYWPLVAGKRTGALRNELEYFVGCVKTGQTPDIITPRESRMAVKVICAAERSAETNEVVKMQTD